MATRQRKSGGSRRRRSAATGIRPTVDFVFKRLFATEEHRDLLISLLNCVLDLSEGDLIVSIEYVSPARNRKSNDEKLTIVDILVRDQKGRHFIIEMQLVVGSAFLERLLYYWACEYVDQLEEGDSYEKLERTFVVCISLGPMVSKSKLCHHRWRIGSDVEPLVFSDRLEIHTIELCKFGKKAEEIETDLDRWLYFLKHGEKLNPKSLPARLETPPIRHAMEVLNVISQNKLDRAEYRARLKRQRDEESHDRLLRRKYLEEGIQKGIEQGIQQGVERGLTRGQLIGRIRTLEELLRCKPLSKAKLDAMTNDELARQAETLHARVTTPNG